MQDSKHLPLISLFKKKVLAKIVLTRPLSIQPKWWIQKTIGNDHVFQIVFIPGIRGTYQGLNATIMKQGSNQAIRFFVMDSLKEWYRGGDPQKNIPILVTALFGGFAGACSVFGNTPLDVIKTRMQVSVENSFKLKTKGDR